MPIRRLLFVEARSILAQLLGPVRHSHTFLASPSPVLLHAHPMPSLIIDHIFFHSPGDPQPCNFTHMATIPQAVAGCHSRGTLIYTLLPPPPTTTPSGSDGDPHKWHLLSHSHMQLGSAATFKKTDLHTIQLGPLPQVYVPSGFSTSQEGTAAEIGEPINRGSGEGDIGYTYAAWGLGSTEVPPEATPPPLAVFPGAGDSSAEGLLSSSLGPNWMGVGMAGATSNSGDTCEPYAHRRCCSPVPIL